MLEELMKKYEVKSNTLLKVIQHPESSKEEIKRCSIARRFTKSMEDDLKSLRTHLHDKLLFDTGIN